MYFASALPAALPIIIVWTVIASVAIAKRRSGSWTTFVIIGAGGLALLNLFHPLMVALILSRGDAMSAMTSPLMMALGLAFGLLSIALTIVVAIGIFKDRPALGSRPHRPDAAPGGVAAPPPPPQRDPTWGPPRP